MDAQRWFFSDANMLRLLCGYADRPSTLGALARVNRRCAAVVRPMLRRFALALGTGRGFCSVHVIYRMSIDGNLIGVCEISKSCREGDYNIQCRFEYNDLAWYFKEKLKGSYPAQMVKAELFCGRPFGVVTAIKQGRVSRTMYDSYGMPIITLRGSSDDMPSFGESRCKQCNRHTIKALRRRGSCLGCYIRQI